MRSCALICLAIALLLSAPVFSQVPTSRLKGTVEDRSGAANEINISLKA